MRRGKRNGSSRRSASFQRAPGFVRILAAIGREISKSRNLETLCDGLTQALTESRRFKSAVLYLFDPASQAYVVKAASGAHSGPGESRSLAYSDSVVQSLSRKRRPLVRQGVAASPGGKEGKAALKNGVSPRAEVWLPLCARSELTGILKLTSRERRGHPAMHELQGLSLLADQVAMAIDNARTRDRLEEWQRIVGQANRWASLGHLIAGLVHEIRNPLGVIRTFAQLLPERYRDAEFRGDFQSVALKELDRVSRLVDDLLNFSRPSPSHPSPEDVNDIVAGVVRILETQTKENGVRLRCRLSPDLSAISVDKEQIKQVCLNLLLNALQAIETEGCVEIATRSFPHGSRRFVQIEIRDNGVGIAEGDLENIFRPFFTTKKGGSGLGLFISRQIIEDHGGSISVSSIIGEGTTFFINLPAKAAD